MDQKNFYIGGEWIEPVNQEIINVINPATEEIVSVVSNGNAEDLDKAVKSARNAFNSFSQSTKEDRLELLKRIYENYEKRKQDIAEIIRLEMGAPIKLANGAQSNLGLQHIKTAIRVLENHEFEFKHKNLLIRHEPIGICGLITPWNWPVNQIMAKLGPSLAAGCTSILKPSELAPGSAMIIAEIIDASDAPPGVFNLINGYGNSIGEAISSHPDIDMVSITGSNKAGIAVAKGGADSVKRISQELGGKSANIIFDDDDFKENVMRGVKGCMNNTGQSCNAPTRMLIPESSLSKALLIAKETCSSLITGEPSNENTDLGPQVSKTQFNKVQNLINQGIEEGAQLVAGGTGSPDGLDKGYYSKPTIFANVSEKMSIFKEEIFGPVLCIITYKDIDDAISIANNSSYGLASFVSGKNKEQLIECARKIRAGQVHINYKGGGTDAPFGGYKKSGNGREKAEWGLDEFLEIKAIMMD
jgi:aldehyde dehydrogenase (NAD+)